MSNSALQAEVYRLQSILSDIERENSRLSGEISQGVHTVNQANSTLSEFVNSVDNSLNNSAKKVHEAQNLEEQAYQVQLETEKLYPLFKNMEEANKNIRDLNNKKYYEFVQYRIVRKIMQGFMENLDLNLVNVELIYKAVEKNHLQTPDYWLTSAMLAIMAWKSDQRELAERAIKEALSLDKKNAIIFFFIFNLRMARDETAVKWLLEYEKCEMTGDDKENFLMMFSLISKTLHENVSPEVRATITDYVNIIIQQSLTAEGYSEEELVNRIASRFYALIKPGSYDLPNLARSVNGFEDITRTLDMAANNYNILEKISGILNVSVSEHNKYLKEFMDQLLSRPNEVEKDTYDLIRFNETVLLKRGDKSAAQEAVDTNRQEEESQINLISCMVDWADDENNEAINEQMRYNMFVLVSDYEKKGTHRYAEQYRSRYKEVWPVEIGEYGTTCDFGNYNMECQKIGVYFQNWLAEQLKTINNTASYVLFAISALLLAGGIYLKAYIPAAIAAVVGVAVGFLLIYFNNKKKENLKTESENRTSKTIQQLQVLFGEFDVLRQMLRQYDSVTAQIDELFTRI